MKQRVKASPSGLLGTKPATASPKNQFKTTQLKIYIGSSKFFTVFVGLGQCILQTRISPKNLEDLPCNIITPGLTNNIFGNLRSFIFQVFVQIFLEDYARLFVDKKSLMEKMLVNKLIHRKLFLHFLCPKLDFIQVRFTDNISEYLPRNIFHDLVGVFLEDLRRTSRCYGTDRAQNLETNFGLK